MLKNARIAELKGRCEDMGYNWPGMRKIPWEEVKELIKSNEIVGCFKLYDDKTEGMIEEGYDLDDIINHHENGGEFGEEIADVFTTEWCPYCEEEVEIKSVGPQVCPNCKNIILPCSACDGHSCSDCGYEEEESYKIARDKKTNAEYWDKIESTTEEYIRKVAGFSIISDIKEVAEKNLLDIAKAVSEATVKELESIGGVYPVVDENM